MRNYPRKNAQSPRKQQGFSLIELGVVIFLIALLGFGVYALFADTDEDTEVAEYIQDVRRLAIGCRKAQTPRNGYQGITGQTLIQQDQAPDNFIQGNALINPYGNTITVSSANYNSGTNNACQQVHANIQQAICADLVNQTQSSFVIVRVGSATLKDDSAGTTFTAAQLGTACSNGGNVTLIST